MTVCLGVLAVLMAVVAAVRSTWSPCGLSMLSTITPVSERGRGASYRSTATWFVIGSAAGGASLGAVMAAAAVGVRAVQLPVALVDLLALGAALVAAGSDAGAGGFRLPIHRRQVNERWLDQYRPWVYGAGFGWQIGSGLSTYITTAAVYLMVVLCALTGQPTVAAAVGVLFGILRGLAAFLTRRLNSPAQLLAFHRRFVGAGPRMGQIVVGVEVAAAGAVAAVLDPLALLVTAVLVAGVAVLCSTSSWMRDRHSSPTCTVATDATSRDTRSSGVPGAGVPSTVESRSGAPRSAGASPHPL